MLQLLIRFSASATLALLVALNTYGADHSPAAQGAAGLQNAPLRVVVKSLTPFVMIDDGSYTGFSIDLWQEIASRMGVEYEYSVVDNVSEQINAVNQGAGDLAITGISITKTREEMIDFTQPYFRAGLQLLTKSDARAWTGPHAVLGALVLSSEFLTVVGGLIVTVIVVGHAFWLIERRRNPDFPQRYLPGVWEGIWYTVVTLVTVGYGDRTARSVPGRLLAMLWMFASVLLVANFTANITSQLTFHQFQGSIQSVADLPGKRIATVDNSTAAQYLANHRLPFVDTPTIEDAYALLQSDEVDVVVYDSPVLLYYAHGEGRGKVQVTGDVFEPEQYGIVVATGSSLREQINRTLLSIYEDGRYDAIYAHWFDVPQE